MENAVMIGVFLAVVGVGLFGLYYANTDYAQPTIYRPVPITGLGTDASNSFFLNNEAAINIEVISGVGFTGFTDWIGTVAATEDAPNPLEFSSFNDSCNGCRNFTITASPKDKNYGGSGSEYAVCGIINSTSSNVNVNLSINQSTSGVAATVTATMIPWKTNTTPSGVDDSVARDDQANGSFCDTCAISFTSTRTVVIANLSIDSEYSLSCKWSFDSTQPAGTYVTTVNYFAEEAFV